MHNIAEVRSSLPSRYVAPWSFRRLVPLACALTGAIWCRRGEGQRGMGRGWHVSSLSFVLFHSFLADVCQTFRNKIVRRWSIRRVALWNGRALDMVKHENTFDLSIYFSLPAP